VQHKALNVINRIPGDQRVEKSWKSVDREGLFKIHTNPIPGMDFLKDDWLILTRTNHLLDKIEVELQSRGIFYQRHNSKSVSDKLLLAINTWTKLTRGKSVSLEGVKAMYNFMSVNVGVSYGFKTMPGGQEDKEYTYDLLKKDYGLLAGKDLIWHVALDQVSDKKIAYIISALKKDQNLNYEAKIKLSTIHGSKGGQAQNVLLFSDLTYKVDTEYMRDRSDERRVFYVGMTRAKEQLHVVRSQTNREFKEMFW
jgi:superfamily I DNA/RNA helicase